jgi:hypothetical protein
MQTGWNHPMLERQHRFDKATGPSSGIQMANICFD